MLNNSRLLGLSWCKHMKHIDWETFYSLTKDSPPWPSLVRVVSLLPQKGRALDLGAGAGRDTRYLLEQGFQVTAVDRDPHPMHWHTFHIIARK